MPSRRERANAIRALSMDAVQKANSGHPGAPMGMADIAEVLWRDSNVIEVHINRLRGKLGRELIQTRRGQGYCFGSAS